MRAGVKPKSNSEYSIQELWSALHTVITDVEFFRRLTSDMPKDATEVPLEYVERLFHVYGPKEFMTMYNNYIESHINFGDIIEVTYVDRSKIVGAYIGKNKLNRYLKCDNSDDVKSVPNDDVLCIKLLAATNMDRMLKSTLAEYEETMSDEC